MLAATQPQGRGRRIAILGDMLELGEAGPALHAPWPTTPDGSGRSGPHRRPADATGCTGRCPPGYAAAITDTADEMVAGLPQTLRAGDVLLIKGSKSIKVSRVVDALRKLGQAAVDHTRGPR